ncbi:aminotransferase class I/II-fold pyridoxal phosphate-dependent enzyme [Cytophagales bacterium RKSG123]|nr:aminotransferase class I/II-fold pyridoxal phosphate-dependent enzyme [Xanthovirga aplysinae]
MRELLSPASNTVDIFDRNTGKKKKMYMFGSNNYLGLANDNSLLQKIQSKIVKYGIGLGGPPLLNGYTSIHKELEKKVSSIKNKEDALLFSSGYCANLGLISGLLNKKDLIIYDEYSHASLIDGIKLSGALGVPFRHNDMTELKRLIINLKDNHKNTFIAFEGLYSMDGDTCRLDKIIGLAKKYGTYTILDDSHATGVLGKSGKGACEKFNLIDSVDFIMGSFSKAFSLTGGFVCGSKAAIDYLRVFSRQYMFSTSMPPILVASILSAIEVQESSPQLLSRLKRNTRLVIEQLRSMVEFAATPEVGIVVIRIPEKGNVIKLNEEFHSRNIFINSVSYPAVPINEQRFRISLMSTHTEDDINYLVDSIKDVWKKYHLSKLKGN